MTDNCRHLRFVAEGKVRGRVRIKKDSQKRFYRHMTPMSLAQTMTTVQELFIQLFDKDVSTDDFLGQASVELRE